MEGLLYVLTLMLRHQALGILPLLGAGTTVVYLPAPCPLPVAPHDFSRSEALIAQGHALAHAFLAGGLDVVAGGIVGHPHFHGLGDALPLPAATPAKRLASAG